MLEMLPEWLQPLAMVLFIDVVLAGDNAIVVGMAAAGLPTDQRKKAIFWGIIAATVMRIAFASITVQLLQIVGIVLAGGVLLLWVCWKMYRELRDGGHDDADTTEQHEGAAALEGQATPGAPRKTLRQAITQILVADVSMSLDNVLAVAGAAKDHPYILIVGLAFSVVLMGVAATLIANLLNKHRWIAWVGLLVILYVAGNMIYEGTHQVTSEVPEAYAYLFLPLGFLAPTIMGVFPVWLWVGATVMQMIIYTSVITVVAGVIRGAMRPRPEG
ncbi:TerC family protein [Roseomonas oryzicola]|uniref:TerC family protein n=1 Tax=Neoroseomonas oryzicola TaxID=535904 RepID=A0A9X9WMX8_9PROT|nr:TerC family protein [Neoroseomonas oryzicola]NKE20096.1 TerC family protein [Neoroseomonas oryzicola]